LEAQPEKNAPAKSNKSNLKTCLMQCGEFAWPSELSSSQAERKQKTAFALKNNVLKGSCAGFPMVKINKIGSYIARISMHLTPVDASRS